MKPLVKTEDRELSLGSSRMQFDHITPGCNLCGRERIGTLTPAYLALRGHWALIAELGCEAFVLDSKLIVDFVQLPGGTRKAIIVDMRFSRDMAATTHEECAEKAVTKLGELRACEDAWGDIAGEADAATSAKEREEQSDDT